MGNFFLLAYRSSLGFGVEKEQTKNTKTEEYIDAYFLLAAAMGVVRSF